MVGVAAAFIRRGDAGAPDFSQHRHPMESTKKISFEWEMREMCLAKIVGGFAAPETRKMLCKKAPSIQQTQYIVLDPNRALNSKIVQLPVGIRLTRFKNILTARMSKKNEKLRGKKNSKCLL